VGIRRARPDHPPRSGAPGGRTWQAQGGRPFRYDRRSSSIKRHPGRRTRRGIDRNLFAAGTAHLAARAGRSANPPRSRPLGDSRPQREAIAKQDLPGEPDSSPDRSHRPSLSMQTVAMQ
jgi:hypothetical protein